MVRILRDEEKKKEKKKELWSAIDIILLWEF